MYFYYVLEEKKPIVAQMTKELEVAIYTSPRTMLTHSRLLIEFIVHDVCQIEEVVIDSKLDLATTIKLLFEQGIITEPIHQALYAIHKLGNAASHEVRPFRLSESVLAWEHLYIIISWYSVVYIDYLLEIPPYQDPLPQVQTSIELEELIFRFKKMEKLLYQSKELSERTVPETINESPFEEAGLVTVRSITFEGWRLAIPYFLRDAFLLPQRFELSKDYLLRLNEQEEARIMSELPSDLSDLHTRVKVKRRTSAHTATFFHELQQFIEEEIRRKELVALSSGELFLFYRGDQLIVTETFGQLRLVNDYFPGMPNLLEQLEKDGIHLVHQLPKELVLLEKYRRVGASKVQHFFKQLQEWHTQLTPEVT